MCVHLYVGIHVCLCVYSNASLYIYRYLCVHLHMYVCINKYRCAHIYACVYIYCNQMLVWCISFFLLCFKAVKTMFPIMCAGALVGLMNIQLRQTSNWESVPVSSDQLLLAPKAQHPVNGTQIHGALPHPWIQCPHPYSIPTLGEEAAMGAGTPFLQTWNMLPSLH